MLLFDLTFKTTFYTAVNFQKLSVTNSKIRSLQKLTSDKCGQKKESFMLLF